MLPEGSILRDVAVNYTLSKNTERVEVNGVEQILGVDSQDFSGDDVVYVLYSDEGIEAEFTVKIYFIPVPQVYIMAFCPDYTSLLADKGRSWIDIKIKNADKLPTDWKVKSATFKFEPGTHFDSTQISNLLDSLISFHKRFRSS